MSRRLCLVRHGPTHAKGMVGWTDVPADLSDTAALRRLSGHLPAEAAVISSDLGRAVATADAIAGNRPRLPHSAALREINFGDWEMQTWSEIAQTAPDEIRAFYERPGPTRAPGGDSWDSLHARVDAEIDRLLATQSSDLIVVCHFGVILSQLQRATGATAYETFAQKIDNLSVTEVLMDAGAWRAGRINHCP